MSDPLDLGILGLGNIGTVHLQTARAMDGVRVTAVADAVPANRRRARSLGVDETYDDYRDLLAEATVDAVVVALPPFLHEDAVVAAAESGRHAFVEKPFATDLESADRMIDAAEGAGVSLGVDHTIRYFPAVVEMKRVYDEGRLGHVPMASIGRVNGWPFERPPASRSIPDWQLDADATGGGALLDLGVHLFDVLEWFFGDLEVAHASTARQLDLPYEDTAVVVLESPQTGTLATLQCGFFQWEEPPEINMRFRLDGVAETLSNGEFVPDNLTLHAAKSGLSNAWRRATGQDPEYFGPTYYYRAHFRALADFVEAVQTGETPPVGPAEGRRTLELVARAYELAGRTDEREVVTP
ncbi:Gfo/Idh/MocA family protein [Halobaculum halobium]|uniref:Gfo/Idh/MocA family protein n=1 Tax=Halobaculum halobium TaxID=3032281 RepID=A0ABD5T5Q2_9EURY|nr:Gfo/Idh/MocA family oxidoreductase [Halobaculum sp. SYNS20]